MVDPSRVYFDSSVFLAYLNNEPGRADVVATLLEDSEQDRIEIVTSTISLAEVVYLRGSGVGQDFALIDAQIDSLLRNSRITTLVQFTPAIAVRAREFVRSVPGRNAQLTVLDAIHLSSAAASSAEMFFAYDRDFRPFESQVEFGIAPPSPFNPRMDLGGA